MVDGWWVDAVSCTWMEVVRCGRVESAQRQWRSDGEGDAGQVSGEAEAGAAAAADTLASAMATWEVKVIVGAAAAAAAVEHTAGERA